MFGRGKETAGRKYPARAPRKKMTCTATIVADNRFFRAQMLDVSQSGCRVRLETEVQPEGRRVQIALESFHSLSGLIRWFKDGEMGIQFTSPLSDYMLAKWTAQLEKGTGTVSAPSAPRPRWRDFWGERRRPPLE